MAWFSSPAKGECAPGVAIGIGGCSWRVAAVGKVLNASCLDGALSEAVERATPAARSCFASCGPSRGRNHTAPGQPLTGCGLQCFFSALYGVKVSTSTLGPSPSAMVPAGTEHTESTGVCAGAGRAGSRSTVRLHSGVRRCSRSGTGPSHPTTRPMAAAPRYHRSSESRSPQPSVSSKQRFARLETRFATHRRKSAEGEGRRPHGYVCVCRGSGGGGLDGRRLEQVCEFDAWMKPVPTSKVALSEPLAVSAEGSVPHSVRLQPLHSDLSLLVRA